MGKTSLVGIRDKANSKISAMRPPWYYLLEEKVILGVIYGSLVWMVCNPAAPAGVRGIPGLSPARCVLLPARPGMPHQACPTKRAGIR